LLCCSGEEDLLGFYLLNVNEVNDYDVPSPDDLLRVKYDKMYILENWWDEYQNSMSYYINRQIQTDEYRIDNLIEHFSHHIVGGTLAYGQESDLRNHARNVRFLAAEPRRQRAWMAYAMTQKIATTPRNVRSSIVMKSAVPDTMFVFLIFPRRMGQSKHAYRVQRQKVLGAYLQVIKLQNPTVRYAYGIATDTCSQTKGQSEDIASCDFSGWTEADNVRAKEIQDKRNVLIHCIERSMFAQPNVSRPKLASGSRKERRRESARARIRRGRTK
jgi:hypothetical protein